MNTCNMCGGDYQDTQITYSQEVAGQFILVKHVSARVCERCGDTLLAPEVVERLQNLIWRKVKPKRIAQVPVFDLA